MIQNNDINCKFIRKQCNIVSIWEFLIDGTTLRAAYDKRTKNIVTGLDPIIDEITHCDEDLLEAL